MARGLSSQLGPVTKKTNYRDLEKVISIWIVSEDIPKGLQNTVTRYHMVKDDLIGQADIPRQYYDKMEMVIIRRGEGGSLVAPVFEYLDAVFSSDIETMDKFTPASANPSMALNSYFVLVKCPCTDFSANAKNAFAKNHGR